MKRRSLQKFVTGAAFTAVIISGLLVIPFAGHAGEGNGNGDDENSKIQIGFQVAPVPLNLAHKNRGLVGLGSYIVNVVSGCNGCHSAGPATEYLGNPALFAPPSLTVHQ